MVSHACMRGDESQTAEIKACAVIVAAGSSTRMGFNKLLAPLAGEAVLRHAIRAFQQCGKISSMVLVAGGEVAAAARQWLEAGDFPKLTQVVAGGDERYLSVLAGLNVLPPQCRLVAVHDGARPLIRGEQIEAATDLAARSGAAVVARPLTETIKRVNDEGVVEGSLSREGVWLMETPQIFAVDLLRQAYQAVTREGLVVTDDVSAVQHIGATVRVCANPHANPKITFPGDLALAERLLNTHPA